MGAQLASRERSLEALIMFIGESGGLGKVLPLNHGDDPILILVFSFPIRRGSSYLLTPRHWRQLVEYGPTIMIRHSASKSSLSLFGLQTSYPRKPASSGLLLSAVEAYMGRIEKLEEGDPIRTFFNSQVRRLAPYHSSLPHSDIAV